MLLGELLKKAGYPIPVGSENIEISGIYTHSARVREGGLFVAIKGLSEDGFCHLDEAIMRGAAFVVAQRPVALLPSLQVEDARVALSRLFNAWYGEPTKNMKLIGITGTNGKTSTAAMLASILEGAGVRCGVIGTVECRCCGEVLKTEAENELANMTTPDPAALYGVLAQMRDRGVTHVVMEVTSHALHFSRVVPLFFERAVFTNLTPDHLDLHGDMSAYFAEKRKLFFQSKTAVISLFSSYGQVLADSLDIPFYTVEKNTLRKVKTCDPAGISFELFWQGALLPISLPVAGGFNVENAALAATTALSLGIEPLAVVEALAGYHGVKGRMEKLPHTGDLDVYIDYAHTPDALEKLLLCAREMRREGQRITLVFGCGGNRDRLKRRKMGSIATRLADLTVITSDNCRDEHPDAVIAEILKGVDKEKPYQVVPDRCAAITYAIQNARAGDMILLAGKGHEEYEICGGARLPFSERRIVAACIEERGGKGK